MFAGLASPSHLIIALAVVLLLFGAKRIPELAKGLGSGIKEFRQGVSAAATEPAESSEDRTALEAATADGNDRASHSAEAAR
jgi:sec-independent protein translocase protein TatA